MNIDDSIDSGKYLGTWVGDHPRWHLAPLICMRYILRIIVI